MNNLPLEIVSLILSYEGSIIKERNGKYINQISKTDSRRELIKNIPVKELFFNCKAGTYSHVLFTDHTFRFTMTEYYNVLVYIFYKNCQPINETRYLCY